MALRGPMGMDLRELKGPRMERPQRQIYQRQIWQGDHGVYGARVFDPPCRSADVRDGRSRTRANAAQAISTPASRPQQLRPVHSNSNDISPPAVPALHASVFHPVSLSLGRPVPGGRLLSHIVICPSFKRSEKAKT